MNNADVKRLRTFAGIVAFCLFIAVGCCWASFGAGSVWFFTCAIVGSMVMGLCIVLCLMGTVGEMVAEHNAAKSKQKTKLGDLR